MFLKQNILGQVFGNQSWNFTFSDKAETPLDWEKTEFQNQIQVLDYKNFAGAVYFSYNFVSEQDEPDEIEYKYLNEFNNETVSFISNFIFEKGVGKGANGSTSFDLSNQLMFQKFLENNFGFGFLGFSSFGEVSILIHLAFKSIYMGFR